LELGLWVIHVVKPKGREEYTPYLNLGLNLMLMETYGDPSAFTLTHRGTDPWFCTHNWSKKTGFSNVSMLICMNVERKSLMTKA
jgi:hypothetical protein